MRIKSSEMTILNTPEIDLLCTESTGEGWDVSGKTEE